MNWRKLKTTDIDDSLQQTQIESKVEDRLKNDSLFALDTVGHLSTRQQKTLKKISLNEGRPVVSRYQLCSVKHTMSTMDQRRQTAERNESKRKQELSVFDLWEGGSKPAPSPAFVKKPRGNYPNPHIVPALKLPHPGQSYNPSEQDKNSAILMAASEVMSEQRRLDEAKRNVRPLSDFLMEYYDRDAVRQMAASTKQWVAARLRAGGDDVDAQAVLAEYAAVGINEPELGTDDGREHLVTDHEASEVGLAESKTEMVKKGRTERNKEARKKAMQAELSTKRKLKLARADVSRVPLYKKELARAAKRTELQRMHRAEVQQQRLDQMRCGIVPRFRIGRRHFEETPLEVNYESNESNGATSLRAMKIAGSAIHDRIQSAYRRGVLEPPAPNSKEHHRRITKSLRLKLRSRRFKSPFAREGQYVS